MWIKSNNLQCREGKSTRGSKVTDKRKSSNQQKEVK